MKIREATITDSPELARIQVDSYRTAYAGFFPQAYLDHFSYEEQTQDWQDLLSSESKDLLFVAENEPGDIVGYALAKAETDPEAGYDSSLVAIHVHYSQQKKGFGRHLLIAVVSSLQAQGCTSLWLSTLLGNPAQAWYERLGGVPFGEVRYKVDETEVVEIKYGWSDITVLAQYADQVLTHPTSNNQVQTALETDQLVDISTTGRKTGQAHRFEIWFHYLDRQIYLTGKPNPRDWYANMVAQPQITFHLKQSEQIDLAAFATPIIEQAERRRILSQLLKDTDYSPDLESWIAGSPLVHIALRKILGPNL